MRHVLLLVGAVAVVAAGVLGVSGAGGAVGAGGARAAGGALDPSFGKGGKVLTEVAKEPLEGARVVLSTANGRLVVRDLAGGPTRPLAAGMASAGDASWAPDGSRVAFVGIATDHRGGIFVVSDRRSGPVPRARLLLSKRDTAVGELTWSPDGQSLTFSADDPVLHLPTIYRINIDGSGLRRLIPPVRGSDPSVSNYGLSPDGRRLLYVQWSRMIRLEDRPSPALLKSAPLGGGPGRTLVDGAASSKDARIWDAGWSPDGRLVAYMNSCWLPESQGICRLAVVASNGHGKRQLPMKGTERGKFAWSELSFAWRSQTLVYSYGQTDPADTVRWAAIYELWPANGKTRTVAKVGCPWRSCLTVTPQIMAVSADGAYAVIAAGFAREQPELVISERSYLLDLTSGSLRRIPTLVSADGLDVPYYNSAVVFLPR